MPSPVVCGIIYILVSGLMLVPAIVPWAAIPRTTVAPTLSPTVSAPSHAPSRRPTAKPSISPSTSPPSHSPSTPLPSKNPSSSPTSSKPSITPSTSRPSHAPTSSHPSITPSTSSPTKVPTLGTNSPTVAGTRSPTANATKSPTAVSTNSPSAVLGLRFLRNAEVLIHEELGDMISVNQARALQADYAGDIRLLWLLWLWPLASHFLMGVAYLIYDPSDVTTHRPFGVMLLGKELDGSMRRYCVLLMLPVLLPLWTFWQIRHSTWSRNERPYDEIVPGIYLGRFPAKTIFSKWTKDEIFPAKTLTLVDLVAEMSVPRSVYKGRMYFCIPTLDQCAPNVEALREIGMSLASMESTTSAQGMPSNIGFRRLESGEDELGEGVRMKGSVFVFCANGRGRSAAFVMALLVMRGHAQTVEEAIEIIRRARPQINPKKEQIQAAREAVDVWRADHQNRLNSAQKATRKRSLSNASLVPDKELISTESNNVIKLEDLSSSSASKKRTYDQKDAGDALFALRQPDGSSTTTTILEIVEEDVEFIVRAAIEKGPQETGGDLFGTLDSATVSVHHIIGAGPSATCTNNAFIQDATYVRECMGILTNLSRLGAWHSREGDVAPSLGDIASIQEVFNRTEVVSHILVIVAASPRPAHATVAAYVFKAVPNEPCLVEQLHIRLIPSSAIGDHQKTRERLLDCIRLPSRVMLLNPENPEQRGEILPQPHLESTESRNVIDLALQ